MKLTPQDLAALISGTTIILNECTVQFVLGGTMGGVEEEDAPANGIGFLADIESVEDEEFEDEEIEEEPEIEDTVCSKTAVKKATKSRRK